MPPFHEELRAMALTTTDELKRWKYNMLAEELEIRARAFCALGTAETLKALNSWWAYCIRVTRASPLDDHEDIA